VRLGESIKRERTDVLHDGVLCRLVDSIIRHARTELAFEIFHAFPGTTHAHGAANFAALPATDPYYRNAQFYLGVTKTQLRKTGESIKIFENLRGSGVKGLSNQISLQLAYAHIKNYTEEDYVSAEEELDRAMKHATDSHDMDLQLQVMAVQVFLYSVLAGRAENKDRRPIYADTALQIGKYILNNTDADAESAQALRFEALNGLGITWMRLGESGPAESRADSWAQAQGYYDRALMIIPNSVRVSQNMTQLRLLQVKLSSVEEKPVLLAQAKQYCELSLQVSDQDQFPYLLLSRIAIQSGDAKAARQYIRTGRSRPGGVKERDWNEVEVAVRAAESGKSNPHQSSEKGLAR